MILFNIAQKQEKFNKKVQNKSRKFKETIYKIRKKIKVRQKVQRFVLKFKKYMLYFGKYR